MQLAENRIERGHLLVAETTAGEIGRVTLVESLALTALGCCARTRPTTLTGDGRPGVSTPSRASPTFRPCSDESHA
jgi:hypothetical protein